MNNVLYTKLSALVSVLALKSIGIRLVAKKWYWCITTKAVLYIQAINSHLQFLQMDVVCVRVIRILVCLKEELACATDKWLWIISDIMLKQLQWN